MEKAVIKEGRKLSYLSDGIGLLIGFLAFFIVLPSEILSPSNIGWLGAHEDMRTYYLGWDFFRHTPWQIPITANPRYGMEFASSVFMTDTIPLLAIFFKLFDPILPPVFQYHGGWLLVCYMLQGLVGWKLGKLVSENMWARGLIAAFFVFQTPFMSRSGHIPLMAQFFVLASLLTALQKHEKFQFRWILLIAGAAGTNAYLLAMVGALWFADYLRRQLQERNIKKSIIEFIGIILLTGLTCAFVGYFSVGSSVNAAATPYGLYRFNLLSPFDSNSWSYLLKDIPGGSGDYEGFAFFGLGFLLLLVAAGVLIFENFHVKKVSLPGDRYLYLMVLILLAYSITTYVGFGDFSINIPHPAFIDRVTSIFRGAGRFSWVALYFALFLTVYTIFKFAKPSLAIGLVAIALILQVVDTRAGWIANKQDLGRSSNQPWKTTLQSPFWAEVGPYQALRGLPAMNIAPHWSDFAKVADENGMQTDFIYTARVDYAKINALNESNLKMVVSGNYKEDVLYIVQPKWGTMVLENVHSELDLVAMVDGYMVVAPGWRARHPDSKIPQLNLSQYIKPVKSGEKYRLVTDSPDSRALLRGWASVGDGAWALGADGIWSIEEEAELRFPVADADFSRIQITGYPLVSPVRNSLKAFISVNGQVERQVDLTADKGSIDLRLTGEELSSIRERAKVTIKFRFPDVRSPLELGINGDSRPLSYAVKDVLFN